jgi:hypothetical protein
LHFWYTRLKRAVITPKPPESGYFAEGETMDDLKKNIKRGIECYYENASEVTVEEHNGAFESLRNHGVVVL